MDTEREKKAAGKRFVLYCISIAIIVFLFSLLSEPEIESQGAGGNSKFGGGVRDGNGRGSSGAGSGEGRGTSGGGKELVKGASTATEGGNKDAAEQKGLGRVRETTNSDTASVEKLNDSTVKVGKTQGKTENIPDKSVVKKEDQAAQSEITRGAKKKDADQKKSTSVEQKKWKPFIVQVSDKKKVPEIKKTVTPVASKKTPVRSTVTGSAKEYATRNERGSGAFARKMGATRESEDAVDRGLAWLASVQNSDGHWNADGRERSYPLSYPHVGNSEELMELRRKIAVISLESDKRKKKYVAEKQKLIDYLEKVKDEENRKLAAKKSNILNYTTEEADKNRQEYEMAVGKAEKLVKTETEKLTKNLNVALEAAREKTSALQQEMNQLISDAKNAEKGVKGKGGILKGYRQLESRNHDTGATGLALLAFMGAGHTHKNIKSKYRKNVAMGILWLLSRESDKGEFSMTTFYEQGIATMAICEAYGMTKDPRLKKPAQQAASFVASQMGKDGGYGYDGPGDDIHVTSFQVMALKSAILAGLNVPKDAIIRLLDYYERALNKDGTTGYSCGDRGSKNSARTAIGLFVRMFMKVKTTDRSAVQIANVLDKVGPQINDLYQVYDGTYAMFQMGGGYWKRWNERFRDQVIKKQNDNGSWRGHGGRVVATSFYIMSLEVYYRYLPVNR